MLTNTPSRFALFLSAPFPLAAGADVVVVVVVKLVAEVSLLFWFAFWEILRTNLGFLSSDRRRDQYLVSIINLLRPTAQTPRSHSC